MMMKKKVLISLLFAFIAHLATGQNTAIPDANFEDYLETHSENGVVVPVGDANSMGDGIANNGLVLTANISDVLSLDVTGLNISNLTGIQGFGSLETLACSGNNLTVLDVSNNANLKTLLCSSNQLANINLNNNANLETLDCSDNQIQNLNLVDAGQNAYNPLLESLICSDNQLSDIDISKHPDLRFLNVSSNRLTGELIVSNNLDLENLFCASNQISLLNLTANSVLKNLNVSNNILTDLDLSAINSLACPDPQTNPLTVCQGTGIINVSQNQLSSLNLANGFNDLISTFSAEDNPDLFCIQVDAGFAPPNSWTKDDWTYYGETACTDDFTYVPDDNFENYLETHDATGAVVPLGDATALGDGVADNNFVLTAQVVTVNTLDIQNNAISNIIGIEDFTALQTLNCSNNQIENIDLSNNTNLLNLDCSSNSLMALDLTLNTLLQTLNCSAQSISSLDLSANTNLVNLNCSGNSLVGLDVAANTFLTDLDCSSNQIERLNIVTNTVLVTFLCNNNNLFALNLQNGNNAGITTFDVTNNPNLFCIAVDDVANANAAAGWQKDVVANYNLNCGTYIPDDNFEQALIDQGIDSDGILNNFVPTGDINMLGTLDVSGEGISDFTGIEDFGALTDLDCSNNTLSVLDLSSNTALQTLDCSFNQIESLDLVPNTALASVLCNDNALLMLDIRNGSNGTLVTLNATNNPSLFCINVDDAANIPGGWQKDAIAAYNNDCDNNRFTAIPDDFFEQALIDLGLDAGPLDDQVLTANIEHLTSLNVRNKQIASLEGIQDFALLQSLECSNNYLNDLDVSGMANLEELYCSSNYFLTNNPTNPNGVLNTTGTVNLRVLFCSGNNLGDLDISANVNLEQLDCADNNLGALNTINNTQLKELNCSNNNLLNLNIGANLLLEELNCDSNAITNITTANVNNTTLTKFSCANNDLTTLALNNYTGLLDMNCSLNDLTQLDITANNALESLDATDNAIATLVLTGNPNLISLRCSQNDLAQLVLNGNGALEVLKCDNNQLTQLVLNNATAIQFLSCANNDLTDLDVSNNTNLIELNINSNAISNLLLSNNLNQLKSFNCSANMIIGGIDLSTMGTGACPTLSAYTSQEFCSDTVNINVSGNALEFLNIQNGINSNISVMNATLNPDLTCIQVDDENAIGANWQKDAIAQYSVDCRFGETYVPDDNFEQALIDLGYDVAPLNDYVPTATIAVLTDLNVSGEAIADLTGIEDFRMLQNLNVANNTISTIDLEKLTGLTILNCSNNDLTNLDASANTLLIDLDCSGNTISTLDLSANTALTNLNIANNGFAQFDASGIPTLEVFNCDMNQIVDLDFSSNTALTNLSCASNPLLESLNLKNGQNANLTNLNAQNNPNLNCIETDTGNAPGSVTWLKDATAQYAVDCHFGETYVPDDAFETALINLGYDADPLDDYVLTSNISNISFLDVGEAGISDLTGIEDFVSLTTLIIEQNQLTNVDLSSNVLLQNLDASRNQLTGIDLSLQPNLAQLNVSNNQLTQIDLNANLALWDLNVSNNNLAVLGVSLLGNLQKLNCSANALDALSVVANPNLVELFCQSNLFFQDRLNLQNGANATLTKFSATNNPDLRCILVDDPFTVISNVDGTYDDWFKDLSATYQSVCADADNDGVANVDDLCPGTPFGDPVDLFGCSVLNLPNDNFTVLITDETCLNTNNGQINIVTKELFVYKVLLTGEDFNKEYTFTNEINILNLLAGTYRMCITLDEYPNYERCYDIVINHPEHLSVITGKQGNSKQATFQMSGSSNYHVEFNGFQFTTSASEITLNLEKGTNTIKISTDLECQGTHEESIFISDNTFVYPNPFQNELKVYLGDISEAKNTKLSIYTYLGQMVYFEEIKNLETRNIYIDTDSFTSGFYTVVISNNASTSTFKIVKK